MKYLTFGLSLLLFLVFTACEKDDLKDKMKYEICVWDGSKVADTTQWKEFVVEPLVTSTACGCLTEGILKYVKKDANGNLTHEAIFVKYIEKDPCDVWGFVSYCNGGDKKLKGDEKSDWDRDEKDKKGMDDKDKKDKDKKDKDKKDKDKKCDEDKKDDCVVCKFQLSCSNTGS